MGYNISGLAINRNFNKDLNELAKAFNWKMELVKEVSFEEASANWTPNNEVNVYFSDSATLLFIDSDRCMGGFRLGGAKVLTFVYTATSMAFLMNYWNQDKVDRYIMEVEGDIMSQRGEKLALEAKHSTTDGLIFGMIDEVLGEPFGEIELGATAYKCEFV